MIQESGTGFSVKSVVLAVLMTLTGFVMYCVWAGFIASIVDKVDDVSSAMAIFQIPVMAGFMISYIGSLMEMDTLIRVSEYVPIVSPFVMPADVLVGKAGFVGGVISFLILLVFTLALILLTGKVYKGKIFNKK
jgi:ABC-type Na+ efflux pump permease subunit